MNPISRTEFIKRLRKLGFEAPFSGGKHSFMKKGWFKLRVPNPHQADIDGALINEILRQAGISQDEWNNISK